MKNTKLMGGLFFPEIEKSVSSCLGKQWQINEVIENRKGAMHEAVILKGNDLDIFVKAGEHSFSPDQFRQEALGLKYLKENTPIYTPRVIDVLEIKGTVLLILEAVNTREPECDEDWRILGRGLARIHRVEQDKCGLHTHSYLGIFYQDNTYEASWHEFYGERRLRPQMKMALDRGMMREKIYGG